MSIQVGVFCRETAMASTEKRESSESSPLFLDVRIALKLSVFVWTIKLNQLKILPEGKVDIRDQPQNHFSHGLHLSH